MMIEERELTRDLKVMLTDEEVLALAREGAKETDSLREAREVKKRVVAQMTATVEAHRTESERIASLISCGYEYRLVGCSLSLDYKRNVATIIRNDTGDVVEHRPLTPQELQRELSLDADEP